MSIRDLLYEFERVCRVHCETYKKRTLNFEFTDKDLTMITFHIQIGFIVYDGNGWYTGGSNEPKKGLTDPDVMDVLRALIKAKTIDKLELEKQMLLIT